MSLSSKQIFEAKSSRPVGGGGEGVEDLKAKIYPSFKKSLKLCFVFLYFAVKAVVGCGGADVCDCNDCLL